MIFVCGLSFKIMVFNATLQQYFSYIVAVSFIGGRNRSTRRKPPTCCKSLTNFNIILYRVHERDSNSQRYWWYICLCCSLFKKKNHSTLHVIKLFVLVAYIIVHSIISTYIFIYRLFGHVPFDLYEGIFSINQLILILEHIGQCDITLRRLIPKKNDNASF